MNSRSTKIKALVLHRRNVGETDRIIILLTQKMGKMSCIAKGVRKPSASGASALEPGNVIESLLIRTKSLPILTQVQLQTDTANIRENLKAVKQLLQVLEIVDALFVEEEISDQLFELVLKLRQRVVNGGNRTETVALLERIIEELGFPIEPVAGGESLAKRKSITTHVEELIGRKLKSFDYLTVNNK